MYTCHFWGNPPFFSLLRLASSACKSLQCLISALTRRGESGLLFGLTCSVVLRRGTVQTNTAAMCGECSWWVDQRRVAAVQGSLQIQAAPGPRGAARARSQVGCAFPPPSWSQAVILLADMNHQGS